MANVFVNLPVPAGNGVGAGVDVSAQGAERTVQVNGAFTGLLTIEISNNGGVTFVPWISFGAPSKQTAPIAAQFMRVRRSGVAGGAAPDVDVGANDDGSQFATLVAPAGNGSGAAVDVSGLGVLKTVIVAGTPYLGVVIIEGSEDGVGFDPCLTFGAGGGVQSAVFASQFMRVTRSGIGGGAPGLPIVAVGGINDTSTTITDLLDFKQPVRLGTTVDVPLAGLAAIDGVVPVAGDRILVKNQVMAQNNGIYIAAAGAWARSNDANTSAEVTAGMFVIVEEGTVNADTGWLLITNNPIVLGVTLLTFARFPLMDNVWREIGTTILPQNNSRSLQMDDGGNARGDDSSDFQQTRAAATQVASGDRSFIGNGERNTASDDNAFVAGGRDNIAAAPNSFAGGRGNTLDVNCDNSVAIGGLTNVSTGAEDSAVVAGSNHALDQVTNCGILAGEVHEIGDGVGAFESSAIAGGNSSEIRANFAFIGGGVDNVIEANRGAVVGGSDNTVTGLGVSGAVCGGDGNDVTAADGAILGGQGNTVSGVESVVIGGTQNIASGENAVASGNTTRAEASESFTTGDRSRARLTGQRAHANGINGVGTFGDAQYSDVPVFRQTLGAAVTALTLDGGAPVAGNTLVLLDDSAWGAEVSVVGRNAAAEQMAYYVLRCGIRRGAGAGTTVIVGVVDKVIIAEDIAAWDANLTADVVNGALQVEVTGVAATTINWVAQVRFTEIVG